MKRICLVALSAAIVTTTMALSMDDASAQRRGGVNRAGVGGVGVNRVGINRAGINRVGVNRIGLNRPGIANRPGLVGNRVGWNGNWNRPGWGVAAASLALGAAAATAYNYAGYDGDSGTYDSGYNDGGSYYPTRAEYIRSYRGTDYFGPVCNPRVDSLCQ